MGRNMRSLIVCIELGSRALQVLATPPGAKVNATNALSSPLTAIWL